MAKKKEDIIETDAEGSDVEEAELEAEESEEIEAETEEVKEEKPKAPKAAKSKLDELKEKAKALEGKVKEAKKVSIKEEVTGKKEEKKDMLVPIEDYLKASIHLGTRVVTPHMKSYVYRRRADGLAVFNTDLLDEKIKEGAEYLAKFAPEDMVVICKREAGWKAAEKFARTIGARYFTKKYPAGILTNINLANFFETNLVFIADPWLDKNALADANKIKIPVLAICDTNNYTFGIEQIIPGNNKSGKSLGIVFYLLAKLYIKKRKMNVEVPDIREFIEDWDNLEAPQ